MQLMPVEDEDMNCPSLDYLNVFVHVVDVVLHSVMRSEMEL